MWVSRKRWEALEARVKELEYHTSMTSFPSGHIASWLRPALPINQVVERLAENAGLKHRKTCKEEWPIQPSQSAAVGEGQPKEKP